MRDTVQCNLLEIHKALQHTKDSEKACSKDACEIPFNSVFPKLTWLWKVFLPPTYQLTFQKTQPGKIYLINLAKKKNKQENEPTNKNPQRSLEKTASGLDIRREETPALPTHSQLAQSLLQQWACSSEDIKGIQSNSPVWWAIFVRGKALLGMTKVDSPYRMPQVSSGAPLHKKPHPFENSTTSREPKRPVPQ